MSITLILLALLPAESPIVKQVVNPTAIIKSAEDKERSIGSGVCLKHQGEKYILTAAHVVEDHVKLDHHVGGFTPSPKVFLKTADVTWRHGKEEIKAKALIVAYDAKRDLALLKPLSTTKMTTVSLAPPKTKLEPGDDVLFCGAGILDYNLSKSYVSKVEKSEFYLAASTGWFGHSGSGVYTRSGDIPKGCKGCKACENQKASYALVGVLVAAFTKGHFRLAIAVDRDTIQTFLEEYTSGSEG